MDLEEKLKRSSDLYKSLKEIEEFCNKTWHAPLLPWFTRHDVSHSKEIIHLLGQILSPIENTPACLNEHELFVLLASAYLHDIGMQYLKVENVSVDKLTSDEYEIIRKRHAEESCKIILKSVQKSLVRDDFHLPEIEEEYLPVIAWVSKGHATEFFEETIQYFQENPATPLNRPVRGELLASLLLIADELDLQSKRVKFPETAKFNPSDFSYVHWFKHHYVDFVEIKNGNISLTLKFPANANEYKELIKELIETKLKVQIDKVNPILSKETSGLLHLNNVVNIQIKTDDTGTKRALSSGALKELKKMLKKESPEKSLTPQKEDIIHRNIPRPTRIFTGRKDELRRFKEAFGRSNLISIEGLGGIGKTEFSAQCIELYLQQNNVIWFDCSPDSKLDSLIDYCGYSDLLKGESKTELAKYSGFADLIERDKLVIFLDNFQDVMDDSFKKYFTISERRLRNAKFVFIAREHPSLGMVRVVPVTLEGLKNDSIEYAKKVIDTYYRDVVIDDEKLKNVCETVGGHPLAIDLAIQLIHYGETPHEIVRKFIDFKDKSEELSHRLLDEIFNHPKSTKEERELLLNFSIFRAKVEKAAFDYISDDPNKINILHKLMDKQMINHYGYLYGSHPLVREFCYHRLEDKKVLHIKASTYLKTRRKEKLYPFLEEEIFYHLLNSDLLQEWVEMISEKGEEFIASGYANSLKEMMDKVREKGIEQAIFYLYYGDIAQIKGEWNDAMKYFERSYTFPVVDEKTSAMAYIKYGEMLYRKGEVKESLKYFEGGCEICKKKDYPKGLARSINNIGLVLEKKGNLSNALEKHQESLKIREEIDDKSGMSISLNNIGLVLSTKGDLDGALKKHHESLKIREEIGDKSGIAMSLNNIGTVLDEKGDLDDALRKHQESLKIQEEIGDKSGIAMSLNNIGTVLEKKDDLDGALKKHRESLKIQEEIGDKSGIAMSLNNIGTVLDAKGDLDGALKKHHESLKIREEIGDKSGIAMSLNNIGRVLSTKGDLDGALKKYHESLKMDEEIGNKSGIAASLHNIGTVYIKRKDYNSAIRNLFHSKALQNQMGVKGQVTSDYIFKVCKELGRKKIEALANEVFDKLPDELKPFINVNEFIEDKTIHTIHKPNRNAPCSCGSGKRYKKCCGLSQT